MNFIFLQASIWIQYMCKFIVSCGVQPPGTDVNWLRKWSVNRPNSTTNATFWFEDCNRIAGDKRKFGEKICCRNSRYSATNDNNFFFGANVNVQENHRKEHQCWSDTYVAAVLFAPAGHRGISFWLQNCERQWRSRSWTWWQFMFFEVFKLAKSEIHVFWGF